MRRFVDANGVEWTISLNLALMWRMREQGIDMLDVGVIAELLGMPTAKLYPVLYAACEMQRKSRGMPDEQFASGLVGEGLDAAIEALNQEYQTFFPGRWKWAMEILAIAMQRMADEQQNAIRTLSGDGSSN